jgi:hypothetical protein
VPSEDFSKWHVMAWCGTGLGHGVEKWECVKKLGKGERDVRSNSETFRRDPVGHQAHPVELASGRKRVLRRLGATPVGEA